MAGIMIRSGVTITGTGFPKLYPDKRMSEGSLLLIDLSNQSELQPETVVNGTMIPNLAHRTAARTIGAGDLHSLSPIFSHNFTSEQGKVEITSKKGLHIITSNTENVNALASLPIPDLIRTYIRQNSTHSYYVSMGRKVTRKFTTARDFYKFSVTSSVSNTANNLFLIRKTVANPQIAPNRIALSTAPSATYTDLWEIGDRHVGLSVAGFTGSLPADIASMPGSYRIAAGDGSEVIYTLYIEDLTVSGRTHAEVRALDLAIFNESLAVGGKFNGDIYTAPSTIDPQV